MTSTIENTAREFVASIDHPNAETLCSDKLKRLITAVQDATDSPETIRFRQAAVDQYNRDGETEIDDDAIVSVSDDGGAYVQSWVWVEGPDHDDDD